MCEQNLENEIKLLNWNKNLQTKTLTVKTFLKKFGNEKEFVTKKMGEGGREYLDNVITKNLNRILFFKAFAT